MDFKLCLPIIVALRNPYLRQRHWEDIQSYIGRFFTKEDNFTLGNLLDIKVGHGSNEISTLLFYEFLEKCSEITFRAISKF